MQQELNYLYTCLKDGEACVLAAVVKTWGSAPRRPGSLMVVRESGVFEGSVSGGCVEGNVIAEAQAMVGNAGSSRSLKTLEFTVAADDAWQVGLACGGAITILLVTVLPADMPAVAAALAAINHREMAVLSCETSGLSCISVSDSDSASISASETKLSLPIVPQARLVIIGAVHIAQHLAKLAGDCQMQVSIVDPRQAFTEARKFGNTVVSNDWPDEYLNLNPADANTAVVSLTHDPKLDDAALKECLNGPAFYIGCLGSKKTQKTRLERLSDAGFSAEVLSRIYGPVGLDIGAANPAEIAVSIMAQILLVMRKSHEV